MNRFRIALNAKSISVLHKKPLRRRIHFYYPAWCIVCKMVSYTIWDHFENPDYLIFRKSPCRSLRLADSSSHQYYTRSFEEFFSVIQFYEKLDEFQEKWTDCQSWDQHFNSIMKFLYLHDRSWIFHLEE